MPLEVLLGIGSQRKISYLGHYILERKWVDHNVIYEGRQGLCDLCTKQGIVGLCAHITWWNVWFKCCGGPALRSYAPRHTASDLIGSLLVRCVGSGDRTGVRNAGRRYKVASCEVHASQHAHISSVL